MILVPQVAQARVILLMKARSPNRVAAGSIVSNYLGQIRNGPFFSFILPHRPRSRCARMDLPVHAVNSILDMEVTRMNYNLLSGLDGH